MDSVGLADVDQAADAELIAAERLAVRAQRVFAVGPGGEVAEVCGRQRRARGGLEVEDVERVFRLGDDGWVVARAEPAGACLPQQAGRPSQGERACRRPPQQLSTAVRLAVSCLTLRFVSIRSGLASDPDPTPVLIPLRFTS